jgi:hypothetical protein
MVVDGIRLIVHVCVFSLNRFAVERVDLVRLFLSALWEDSHEELRCFVQMPMTTEAILLLLICTLISPANEIALDLNRG